MISLVEDGREDDLVFSQSYESFLQSRRSRITQGVYDTAIRQILGETKPDAFLEYARANPKKAEGKIIQWVFQFRDTPGRYGKKPSGATIRAYLASLRSFLDFCEVKQINWKRVIQITPKPRRASKKRPYKLEEIQALLDAMDFRGKFSVLFYTSTGARLASIEDPKPLTIGDVERMQVAIEGRADKVTIGHVKIYSEDSEEYDAFLTDEALDTLDSYLSYRKNFGETITEQSPLFRAELDLREAKKDPEKREHELNIRPASQHAIKGQIQKALTGIGLQERDFKMVHGFRSFYKTTLEDSGMKSSYIEALLGHADIHDDPDNYFKPSVEKKASQFAKFMHLLYVSPNWRARQLIASSESEALKEQISKLEKDQEAEKQRNNRLIEWLTQRVPGGKEFLEQSNI